MLSTGGEEVRDLISSDLERGNVAGGWHGLAQGRNALALRMLLGNFFFFL